MRPLPLLCVAAVPIAVALSGPREPNLGTVNTLDRLIQERFETLDMVNFGISRIASTPEHSEFRRLRPETPAEREVVRELEKEGLEALFLVAGRRAIQAAKSLAPERKPAAADNSHPSLHHFSLRAVSRPIRLTAGSTPAPDPRQVLPHAAAAFQRFERAGSHEFRVGSWDVVARPLRATRKECLSCHQKDESGRPLGLGDALGVAMYAFARGTEPR